MALVTNQPLPSPLNDPPSTPDSLVRELVFLLGPAMQAADGTLAAEDLRAIAEVLATAYDDQTAAQLEFFPQTASQDLVEWETRLGVASEQALGQPTRQSLIVASRRANGAGDSKTILDAIHAIDPTATLHDNTALASVAANVPRSVFTYAVVIALTVWNDSTQRAAIQKILNRSKPAHTCANLATGVGFYCDSSPLDRTALSG